MSKFVFDWVDDEECEVFLDGSKVVNMNHGEHGWDGMVAIRDTVERIADLLGADIQVVGESGI